jgi:hypothetical protein
MARRQRGADRAVASGTAGKSSFRQRLHPRLESIGATFTPFLSSESHVGFRQRLTIS